MDGESAHAVEVLYSPFASFCGPSPATHQVQRRTASQQVSQRMCGVCEAANMLKWIDHFSSMLKVKSQAEPWPNG